MKSYSVFAQYYDELTANVEYPKRAEYLLELMKRLHHAPGLTLDLACGTGSLTLELYRRGVDIYGIDGSVEMLSEARTKCAEAGADILFLCQDMRSIDLYGTVNTVICSLDSLNHLKNEEELQRVFSKVSFFMDPEGYFLFDMNTPYKHHAILGNETYVYDMEHVFCVWQNRCHSDGRVEIQLDFFEPQVPQKGLYYRSTERFSERAYPLETVLTMLQKAGFDQVQVFDELTFDPPKPESQRLVFAAKKQGRNEISYG